MKITPPLLASMAASAIMFVSSIIYLVIQPNWLQIGQIWNACLIISALGIMIAFFMKKDRPASKISFLAIDLLFFLAVFLLSFTGVLNPEFIIHRPLGLGASIGYGIAYPLLVLAAADLRNQGLHQHPLRFQCQRPEKCLFFSSSDSPQ